MRKTIFLAILTLLLSAATLVADLISPYRGGGDGFVSAPPMRMEVQQPAPPPVRQVHEQDSMQA
ncbi:MAG TPA: hypothetical protein VIJ78_03600 [Pseudolabrys sp.]|nr:hypothetical protein [Pseudolabrys sp.]